jgi:hypothetical protein
MVPAPTKALKALKTKLPLKVSSPSFKQSNAFAPNPGELPLVTLRIQVLGASNLLAKDRNGFSDPYVFSIACLPFTSSKNSIQLLRRLVSQCSTPDMRDQKDFESILSREGCYF